MLIISSLRTLARANQSDQDPVEASNSSTSTVVERKPFDTPMTRPALHAASTASMETTVQELNVSHDDDEHWDDPRRLSMQMFVSSEELPVASNRDQAMSDRSEEEDPRPIIASLANKGWSVRDDGRPSAVPSMANILFDASPAQLSIEDWAMLAKWTPENLTKIVTEQTRYVDHANYTSKLDVGDNLDPIQQRMITDARAEELFDG